MSAAAVIRLPRSSGPAPQADHFDENFADMPLRMDTKLLAEQILIPARTLESWRQHGKGPKPTKDPKTGRIWYLKSDVITYFRAMRDDL